MISIPETQFNEASCEIEITEASFEYRSLVLVPKWSGPSAICLPFDHLL